MQPTIKFKSSSTVEITFLINVSDLSTLLKARSDKIEGRGVRGRPRSIGSETIAEVLALKARGVKQVQIAKQLGLSAYSVSRIVNNRYLVESIQLEEEVRIPRTSGQ